MPEGQQRAMSDERSIAIRHERIADGPARKKTIGRLAHSASVRFWGIRAGRTAPFPARTDRLSSRTSSFYARRQPTRRCQLNS